MASGKILAFVLLACSVPALPALAAEVPASTAPAYSTQATTIGDLIDNPQTHAVLDKHLPSFASNPQIEMASGMTLRQIQSFAADKLTDDVLAKVDADLAKITKPAS